MGGVRTLGPVEILSAGDMSGNLTTNGVDMLSMPFGAIEAEWTGSPTGTFSVDGSLDNSNWYPTGTDVNNPEGSADSTLINLQGIGFRYLRLSYTRTSGTGSLTVTFFGKGGFGG